MTQADFADEIKKHLNQVVLIENEAWDDTPKGKIGFSFSGMLVKDSETSDSYFVFLNNNDMNNADGISFSLENIEEITFPPHGQLRIILK